MLEILAIITLILFFATIINSSSEKILEKSGGFCIGVGIFASFHVILNLIIINYNIDVPTSFLKVILDIQPKMVANNHFLYLLQISSYVFNILVGLVFIKSVKNETLSKRWISLLIIGLAHLILSIIIMIFSFSSISFVLFLFSISYIIGLIKQYKTSKL